ncbi:uncharacterized protein LOC134696419 isoform X2 [Mytilus trossulus]|uniref:uncharacterized protein LOC134696419 isoform X2 n=1 Tax=Mytilus trossulus TaxID=6551 RepID=UPI003007BD8E
MEKRFPAIFGIITLVLLCAGAFSPWWFAFDNVQEGAKMSGERHYTSDSIEVYIGLFYYVAVGEDFRKVMGYEDFIGSTTIRISTFIAVGRWFTRMIHVSFNIYSIKPIGVPYSLILSGIGALFCGIIMIYVSFMYCQHTAARPALVYSGVAMTEYPQTQPYTEGPLPYGQGPVPYGQEPPPYEQLQGKHSIV